MDKETIEKNGYFYHQSSFVDDGATVGAGTHIWHFSHIMSGAVIGKDCNLGQNVFVASRAKIGDRVKIQNNSSIYDCVTLEDDVFVGPSTVFTNVINPRSFIDRKNEFRPTHICQGATIGANATIVCGTTIGRYAIIGAGSVVIRDVDDFALMVGNPAKKIGYVSRAGNRLIFNETNNIAVCPQSGEKYIFDGQKVDIL